MFHKYTLTQHVFDAPLSSEARYWAGFLVTDGCVTKASNRPDTYTLSVSTCTADAPHLLRLAAFLGSDAPLRHKKAAWNGFGAAGESMMIRCPRQLRLALSALGVTPRKTMTAAAPDALIHDRDFWRGAVDGDGSIGIRPVRGRPMPVIVMCSASRIFIEQFSSFIGTVVNKMPTIRLRGSCGRLYLTDVIGRSAIETLRVLYADADVALDRKHNRASYILDIDRLNPQWLRSTDRRLMTWQFTWPNQPCPFPSSKWRAA